MKCAAVFIAVATCVAGVELKADETEQNSVIVRTRAGLVALYNFRETDGPFVRDVSKVGKPADLRITDLARVRRTDDGLQVTEATLIRSDNPPERIANAIDRSSEITIEAWVTPASTDQQGPARVVTYSRDANERNFTLGQDGDRFDIRLRTSGTSKNGIPSVDSKAGSVKPKQTHLVYTLDRSGKATVYVDGRKTDSGTVKGKPSNWRKSNQLALADEMTGDRPWLGTYHLVAIYRRDLSPREVATNFRAGPRGHTDTLEVAPVARDPRINHFETRVAAILANHCLECHDTLTKKGGLDLSQKEAAFAGGESGKAIIAGRAADSLLWQFVESDDMPVDRPALSPAEKQELQRWINEGAAWSGTVIDPAVYLQSQVATQTWVRRLTIPEYIETVRAAVGVDISDEARQWLPPDVRADGFSNTAYNLSVDLKHVESYAQLAETVVSKMEIPAFASRFSRSRLLTDDSMRELIARMGKWLLRGPLEEHEIVAYRGITTSVASAGGDFEEAVQCALEAMLQSPRFIYRVENQRGDGGSLPVGEYELAVRMSYLLWGAPPDEELFRAADSGELYDPELCEAQVRRMLQDPRAVDRSVQFLSEWLNLGRLGNLQPNSDKFPEWSSSLADDMQQETVAFFKEVIWEQERPLTDLLNAQITFLTPQLAEHYGLPSAGDGLREYDLKSVASRGGLLTQGSVLTVGGDEASMVARGLFVLHDLLRGAVKDPPPCVDTTPVPTKSGLTQRSIAEARIADESCGGCHAKFEPLAFGLEKFDGLGTFHERDEHGNPLRDDGEILFPGTAQPVKYRSAAEMMELLSESERVRLTLTWKLAQFAKGRPLVATEAPIVDKIQQDAQKDGGTYAALVTALVMSDLVQRMNTETAE